jgi:FixJ family two-component response regulator
VISELKTEQPAPATIGVVDDDPSVRDSIGSLLRSAGYRAAVFESAEAFLHSNGVGQAACLILDMVMPGLSGLELQQRLSEMRCLIPVIFVTAQIDDEIRARALSQGAVAFFGKPFHDEALLTAIQTATDPINTQ